jgi:acyl-CoA thioester hydrolase
MNPLQNKDHLNFSNFPKKTFDKVRYADTDRQGHVNNSVFSTFLETGRVEILYNEKFPILIPAASFVIASLKLDFLKEIHWPGQVDIGTGILKVGKSSITIYQKLFQNDVCVAQAETVTVQVDQMTGKALPLSENALKNLNQLLLS